jgi:hypothetical protein
MSKLIDGFYGKNVVQFVVVGGEMDGKKKMKIISYQWMEIITLKLQ